MDNSPDKSRRTFLIITDAWKPQVNGVVRTYEHLSAELEKMGHGVRVIAPHDFPYHIPMPGYAEIELALLPARRLARMIADIAPTDIHIATEGPLGRAARAYCLKRGLPFVTAYHTQFPDYVARRVGKILPWLENRAHILTDNMIRKFHAPAAAIITTTESLDAELRRRGYTTPLYNMARGVPVDQFTPGPSAVFDELKHPIALYVGRVAIEKNLEAFLSMPWAGSKVVVGHGPDLAILREKYPDAVFPGKKTGSDLTAHYRAADVFVFPSTTDTFGIVLIEAMACGLPIAAYDVVGPRDIITKPILGAVHATDLAAAAQQALTAPGTAQDRHNHAKQHYEWDAAARRFIEIYDTAIR